MSRYQPVALEDTGGFVPRMAFDDLGMRVAFSVVFRSQNRLVYGDDEEFLAYVSTDLARVVRKFLTATNLSEADYFSLFESTYLRYGSELGGKVRVLLSPGNVQWVSDAFLQRTKEYAAKYNTGIHIHLLETFYQKEYGLRKWGKTPLAHLADLDVLGPELSCAHAVWLTKPDIELLAESGATVCHNASSNLRLRSGIAPVNAMLANGINVAMGTDSGAINDDDDLLQEMRLVAKLHRQPSIEPQGINSHAVLRMATLNAASPTFFAHTGTLEKGSRADLVLLDFSAIEDPYLEPDTNVVDAILYRGKVQHVDTVIVDGKVVLAGGKVTTVNKEEVLREIQEAFSKPADPAVLENRRMLQQLLPHVRRFYQSWRPEKGVPFYQFNSRR